MSVQFYPSCETSIFSSCTEAPKTPLMEKKQALSQIFGKIEKFVDSRQTGDLLNDQFEVTRRGSLSYRLLSLIVPICRFFGYVERPNKAAVLQRFKAISIRLLSNQSEFRKKSI